MQRMVMVTSILMAAGAAGRGGLELATAVGFRGTDESKREQLARLIRDLQAVGVDISNEADRGQESRWVLRPGDSRVRLAFTPEQLAELARAALLADREALTRQLGQAVAAAPSFDVAPPQLPVDVDLVLRAVTARCLLRFTYNGRDREFDPVSMQRGFGGWAVSGFDRGSGQFRTFYLSRMRDIDSGEPGTARGVGSVQRTGTDPLTWLVDPPLDAVVAVSPGFRADAARLLGVPVAESGREWTFRVTNRWAFYSRIAELGERVYLVGPPPIRDQFAGFLMAAIA